MRRMVAGLVFLAVSASLLAETAVQERLKAVQADPVALKAAVDAGRKITFFCANCHGEEGISKTPDVPNLAGQNPAYLLEQFRKFASGERKNAFMQGLIKVLNDEERVQAVLFYAKASVPPSPAEPAQVARGKVLFAKLCVRCHGEEARGNELFPRLAGQKMTYLKTSVTRYRDQTGIRNNSLMAVATSSLTDEQIANIAAYLTQHP